MNRVLYSLKSKSVFLRQNRRFQIANLIDEVKVVKGQRVVLLTLLFLISSVSLAFASMAIFWPTAIQKENVMLSEAKNLVHSHPRMSLSGIQTLDSRQKRSGMTETISYQAWRRIHASA